MNRAVMVRGMLATLLSPIAAAVLVAMGLSIFIVFDNQSGRNCIELALQFIPGVLFIAFLGVISAGLFSALFALGTQTALAWIYGRVGLPSATIHVGISAALGAVLFPVVYPFFERLQGTEGTLALVANHNLISEAGIGALGGAAIGLLWYMPVLSKLDRLNAGSVSS